MLLIPILIWKVRTYQNFHSIHSFRIGFDLLSGVVLLIAALKYDYRITKREIWIAEYFFQTTDAIEFQTISFTIPKSISPDFVPFVAGDFNKWNTSSHPMMDDLSGNWTIAVKFQNREIKYAILVNGNEIASKNVILTYIP
jgi:hypothetical protein